MTFDLEADLRSVFSWNTKQLFVFLQAEYETEENGVNQIVLWDNIVEKKVCRQGVGVGAGCNWGTGSGTRGSGWMATVGMGSLQTGHPAGDVAQAGRARGREWGWGTVLGSGFWNSGVRVDGEDRDGGPQGLVVL